MGVNLNADGDYLYLNTGLGSTGLIGWTMWGWHRRTSGVGYSAVSEATIFSNEGNAGRACGLGFDNAYSTGTETDPNLCCKDTQTGDTDFTTDPSFDTWTFFVISVDGPAGSASMEADWSTDGTTWYSATRDPNGIENSITSTGPRIGALLTSDAQASHGDYAYCGARAEYMNQTARRALIYRDATASGDWAYWRLADASTLTDSSGNSRTLSSAGSISTAGDPTIPSGGGGGSLRRKGSLALLGVGR